MAEAAITALVDDFATAWTARDLDRLRRLWVLDDPGVYYLAASVREPAFGPASVESHFRLALARHSRLFWRIEGLRARTLDADTATAFFFADWAARRAEPAGVPEQAPVGGRLKCVATFRRIGSTWRFLNLAEAAYAPFRFFVSDFERDAADGFAGMPKRAAP